MGSGPTAEDLARDPDKDRRTIDNVFPAGRIEVWAVADAYLRRAVAAEDLLRDLVSACREGTGDVFDVVFRAEALLGNGGTNG